MKVIMLGISLFLFGHIGALVLYNQYRVKSIIKYLHLCRGKELPEKDFLDLLAAYTGLLGFAEPFPDKDHYRKLYENQTFLAFYSRAVTITKYLLIAIPAGFVLAAIVDGLRKAYG